jgi:hypothetical protein
MNRHAAVGILDDRISREGSGNQECQRRTKSNNSFDRSANSAAFIRKTRMLDALNARPVNSSVGLLTVCNLMKKLTYQNFIGIRAIRTVLLIAGLGLMAACEIDMSVAVDGKNPPTFKLSGSGNLHFFIISEVAPENLKRLPIERNSDKDTVLWEIWPNNLSFEQTRIWKLPAITYGKIPQGFIQKIPVNGEPPSLVEGKMYSAGGPAANANGGFVLFTIRNGETVVIDERW